MRYRYFVSYVKEKEPLDNYYPKNKLLESLMIAPDYLTNHKDYEFRNDFYNVKNKFDNEEYVKKFEQFLGQYHKCKCTMLSFSFIGEVED